MSCLGNSYYPPSFFGLRVSASSHTPGYGHTNTAHHLSATLPGCAQLLFSHHPLHQQRQQRLQRGTDTLKYSHFTTDRWVKTIKSYQKENGRSRPTLPTPRQKRAPSRSLASCAIPHVFPPVTLMCKDAHGNEVPYMGTETWSDGSVYSRTTHRPRPAVRSCVRACDRQPGECRR